MEIILDRRRTNARGGARRAKPSARGRLRNSTGIDVRSAAFDVPAGGVAAPRGHPGLSHGAGNGDVHQEFSRREQLVHGFLRGDECSFREAIVSKGTRGEETSAGTRRAELDTATDGSVIIAKCKRFWSHEMSFEHLISKKGNRHPHPRRPATNGERKRDATRRDERGKNRRVRKR